MPKNASFIITLSPKEVRFAQDSIAPRFKDGSNLDSLFELLAVDIDYIEKLPPINVMIWTDGNYWAVDGNRRLFLYKLLHELGELKTIKVCLTPFEDYKFTRAHTTDTNGMSIEVRKVRSTEKFRNYLKHIWHRTKPERQQKQKERNQAARSSRQMERNESARSSNQGKRNQAARSSSQGRVRSDSVDRWIQNQAARSSSQGRARCDGAERRDQYVLQYNPVPPVNVQQIRRMSCGCTVTDQPDDTHHKKAAKPTTNVNRTTTNLPTKPHLAMASRPVANVYPPTSTRQVPSARQVQDQPTFTDLRSARGNLAPKRQAPNPPTRETRASTVPQPSRVIRTEPRRVPWYKRLLCCFKFEDMD